jgi:hypothetical protein
MRVTAMPGPPPSQQQEQQQSSNSSSGTKISRSDSNGTLHDRYSYCKAPSGPHSSSSSLTLPGTGSMANGGRVLYTTALRADSTSGLSHSSNQFAGDAQDDSPFSHTSCSSPTKIRRTEIVSSTHAPSPTFGRGPAFSTSGGLQSEGGFKYHPIHEYPPSMTSMTSAIASPTFSPHPHPPFLITASATTEDSSWIVPHTPTTPLPPVQAFAPPHPSHFPPPPSYPAAGSTPSLPHPHSLHQIPVSIHGEMNLHIYAQQPLAAVLAPQSILHEAPPTYPGNSSTASVHKHKNPPQEAPPLV